MKAVPRVLKDCPKAFFVIVGEGKERPFLESMAKDLGVDSKVGFLGEREDVHDIIHLFDIACCSSRVENFPVSILEYMSCGKAVVSTNVGGIPEMFQDGLSGFLVDKESPDKLAEKIVLLTSDAQLRKFMGSCARKRVCNNFRLDTMTDSYKEFIRGLVL
jgi:glycosyltransferase involved in cell wall biosynthesis